MDIGKLSLLPESTQLVCLPRELHGSATARLEFLLSCLLVPAALFLLFLGDECVLASNSAQYMCLRHVFGSVYCPLFMVLLCLLSFATFLL